MRNSWKLGLVTALGVATTIVGCGDDDDSAMNNGGSGGSDAGTAGSSAGKGGTTNGGSSAGNTTGGKGGTANGGNGGTAGKGGSGGKGGTGGGAVVGGAAGAAEGGAGGAGGAAECMDETVGGAAPEASGGAGGAPAATTATVLIDNITVKNGATVVKTWTFDDGADILDVLKGDVGDKWLRPPFDTAANNLAYSSPYAHDVFSKCDGKPAGAWMNIIPFSADGQWYKAGIGFAQADWSGYTISADIKVVSGGSASTCALQAQLFVNDGAGDKTGAYTYMNVVDGWKTMTLTVPASTMVDHLFVNISDYPCN